MSFSFVRPVSVEEAIARAEKTGGAYLAGGTVLLVNHHHGKKTPSVMISIEGIPSLKGISREGQMLRIGSMVTMDEIEESELLKTQAYALWQAASEVGGPQIRNRATLGGNLGAASPSSDLATPLLSLDARLRVAGKDGERTIPVREFFTGYQTTALEKEELLLSVEIPVGENLRSVFRKVGKRNALSVSCINMAVARTGDRIDVSVGAAAPTPVYCKKTSDLLSEDAKDISRALEMIRTEISPIDDRWATASYRRMVCGNLLRALLEETEEKP